MGHERLGIRRKALALALLLLGASTGWAWQDKKGADNKDSLESLLTPEASESNTRFKPAMPEDNPLDTPDSTLPRVPQDDPNAAPKKLAPPVTGNNGEEVCGGNTFKLQRLRVLTQVIMGSQVQEERIRAIERLPADAESASLAIPALLGALAVQPVDLVNLTGYRPTPLLKRGVVNLIPPEELEERGTYSNTVEIARNVYASAGLEILDLGLEVRRVAAKKLSKYPGSELAAQGVGGVVRDALRQIPGEMGRYSQLGGASVLGRVFSRGVSIHLNRYANELVAVLGQMGPDATEAIPDLIDILLNRMAGAALTGGAGMEVCLDGSSSGVSAGGMGFLFDSRTRAYAASALGEIGAPTDDVLEALLYACDLDVAKIVRDRACEALKKFEAPPKR